MHKDRHVKRHTGLKKWVEPRVTHHDALDVAANLHTPQA